ncbi:MAG: DUF2079 domain-containing protein [Gaiellaceae bacterium]
MQGGLRGSAGRGAGSRSYALIARRSSGVAAAVVGASVLYVAVLSWATISRHHALGSGGYDLGIFDQAAWLMGHGMEPFSTIRGRNLLADHFQPALYLLAPFGAFGATPDGILILQATLLGLASPVLFRFARLQGATRPLALAVALLWLASPVTQWANLFDFHPETAVPLLLVAGAIFMQRGRLLPFAATAVLACSTKEDVCLVYVMWGLLLLAHRRRRIGAAMVGAGIAWFVLATQVAIPALGGNLDYYSARFGGERGSSLGAVFAFLVEHPAQSLGELAAKSNVEILVALVVCSGGLALLAPRFLALAIPGLAANFLSAYSYQHDLHFHYQLVPAAAFALASACGAGVAARRLSGRARRGVALVLFIGIAGAVAFSPAVRELRKERPAGLLAAKRHALSLVPAGVPVAAAPDLVPHLSHRRDIYQLPEPFFSRPGNGEYWSDAELERRSRAVRFVVIDLDSLDPWPRTQTSRLPPMLRRRGFVQIYRDGDVRVFRRV